MKKIFLTISIIIIFNNLFSQSNYFNNYYNFNTAASSVINIYSANKGYVASGIVFDSIYWKRNMLLSKFDSLGNLISFKEYKLDSFEYSVGAWGGGGFARCSSGGYVLGGDIENGISYKQYLMRLNDNLDTLWTKIIYDNTIFSVIDQCLETTDKGFVASGQMKVAPYKFNVLLLKTDSLGNKLWERTYDIWGFNGDNVDRAWNVTETPDKGFLLGCYTYSVPTMGLYQGSGDGVVIKTDSMGNVQWIKNVGGPLMDGAAFPIVCRDSNYLIVTTYAYFTEEYNDYSKSKLRIIKLTPNGNVIWDKQYEPIISELMVMKIIELDNGDIVIGGKKYFLGNQFYWYHNTYLFKINAYGDSIWYREIEKFNGTYSPVWNNLYNLEQTPDGGFVGCGEVFVNTQIPYSMWIFKTDSLGCLQPGCQYVGVEELQKEKGELQIFPNPATTQATITYPTAEKAITLQIYNMLGQLVYEEKLQKGSSQTTIDTRSYKKGLYKVVAGESSGNLLVNGE